MYYVVTQEIIGTDVPKEKLMPHVTYMKELIETGIVIVSGPFSDKPHGGMFVLDAKDKKEVEKLLEKDPVVQAGLLKNNIRPYNLSYLKT